jgi:hypothetical protein
MLGTMKLSIIAPRIVSVGVAADKTMRGTAEGILSYNDVVNGKLDLRLQSGTQVGRDSISRGRPA